MKVAIVGTRTASDAVVVTILKSLPEEASEIVSGGAAGVDRAAEQVADALGLPVRRFLPDYAVFGGAAPLRRNDEIIRYADMVLAFWDDSSAGTQYVITECLRQRKPVQVIRLKEERSSSHGDDKGKN